MTKAASERRDARARMQTIGTIKTGTGAYAQPELERMNAVELTGVRDWATDEMDLHDDGCPESAGVPARQCDRCDYLELLAGATDELIINGRFDAQFGEGDTR